MLVIDRILAPAEQVAEPVEDPEIARYEAQRPDIVLVGNSITRTAFDAGLIEQRLQKAGIQRTVFKYDLHGSGPAVWYLLIKYILEKSNHTPETIVLAARPSILYDNEYGTSPKYRERYFRRYAGATEPVLEQKLGDASGPWSLHAILTRSFSLYRSREKIQKDTTNAAFAGSMAIAERIGWYLQGKQAGERAATLRAAYGTRRGLAGALRATYDRQPDNASQDDTDFRELSDDAALRGKDHGKQTRKSVDRTFLPDIARLCDEHGVHLVLVRHSSRAEHSTGSGSRTDALWTSTVQYLNCEYPADWTIDMTTCWGIGPEHRYAGDHFTAAARKLLSEHFAARYVDLVHANSSVSAAASAPSGPAQSRNLLVPHLWKPPRSAGVELTWQGESLHGSVVLSPGKHLYMSHDNRSTRTRPLASELEIDGDRRYALHVTGACDESVSLILFVMQYNAEGITVSAKWRFDGDLRTSLRTQADTTAIRIAIRIAGSGEFQLDEFRLTQLDSNGP